MNPNPTRTWLLVGVGLILVAGFVFYNFFYQKSLSNKKQSSPSPNQSSLSGDISDPGVRWVELEELDDLSLIKTGSDTGIDNVRYYKIADLDTGGELVLASLEFEGPSLPVFYRFKKDAAGKFYYLSQNSSEKDPDVVSKVLTSEVGRDDTTAYQSINPPEFLTFNDSSLKSNDSVGLFASLQNPQELGQINYGTIYQTVTSGDNGTGSSVMNLRLPDSTYKGYTIEAPFITEDEAAQITWADGTENNGKYTSENNLGCEMGIGDNIIINTVNLDSRLQEAGETNSGDKIYTVSEDDPVMLAQYANYKTGREEVLSIKDFAAQKPFFIWKSGLDIYVIFTNRDFTIAAC